MSLRSLVAARFVRWIFDNPRRTGDSRNQPLRAHRCQTSVMEAGRVAALGHAPVKLAAGESVTVDFGYMRYPLQGLN